MKIEHIAIWTNDLEIMRDFYQTYFNMKSSARYDNVNKEFSSYFLSFESGARIEIMKKNDIPVANSEKGFFNGLSHISISVGSNKEVDNLTERLKSNGYEIFSNPRTTGDGYYESVILDPEGNHVEITI